MWLVPERDRRETPNAYPSDYYSVFPLIGVIHHYSVSSSLEGTARWLCNLDSKSSAHFLIGRDGRILQLAPTDARTWHAGGRTSKLKRRDGRLFTPKIPGNVNGRTIGIEWINWGKLDCNFYQGCDGKVFEEYSPKIESRNKPVIPASQVKIVKGAPWHRYTKKQLDAGFDLLNRLADIYPELGDPTNHTGHEHCDPTRKIDPGPLFPWDKLEKALRK